MPSPCLSSPAGLSSRPADSTLLCRKVRKSLVRWLEGRRPKIIDRWYKSQFDEKLLRKHGVVAALEQDQTWIEAHFLAPLLDLLIEYARTGEERFKAIYQDERLRYASHQAAPSVRSEFFAGVIAGDEAAILEESSQDPELNRALRALLAELHAPLVASQGGDAIHLLALGDCLMNEIRVFLPNSCRRAGINLDLRILYFSARMGRSLSTENVLSFLDSELVDLISFSFLSYEGLPMYPALLREAQQLSAAEIDARVTGILGTARSFLTELRERTDAPFLVHNASGLPLERLRKCLPIVSPFSAARSRVLQLLNEGFQELVANTPNAVLIDEKAVAAEYGYRHCARDLISRRISRQALFHTSRFGEYLAAPYQEILRSFRDLRKTKVLLVDFDHTLWEGVMADGEVHHYHKRQELLGRLKDAGILLVGVSKNDPRNVRWNEIVLKPDDFVLLKIGWEPKVQSIHAAAQQLDLGLDSFVLIDDSPEERELVETHLPAVRTLDSTDLYTWRSLERMFAFPNTHQTEEARARTELYRAQARRREALSSVFDYPAAMNSLQLKILFGEASPRNLDRISELIQRTNQFNTTTIRYGRSQLQGFLGSPNHRVYVAELSDKFGSQGLVAVAIIERRGGEAFFDSFVMSCRAMGFGLERLMLRLVLDTEDGAQYFVGRFIPTDRNTPASMLFAEAGFSKRNETEWVLGGNATRPESPSWFTVLDRAARV